MNELLILWGIAGIGSSLLCYSVVRLSFRDPMNLGTLIGLAVGTTLPPLALFMAIIWFCAWAFSDAEQRHTAVKWPVWWGRIRYRQHRAVRWLWHLGNPPPVDDWYGWRNPPKEYMARASARSDPRPIPDAVLDKENCE